MKKTRVYIDIYYYKAALSGLKTYIEELVNSAIIHGNNDVEYIFSHDIKRLSNNKLFINSKSRIVRWIFHLRYFFWKQAILPVRLIINKADFVICPDYVCPVFCFSKK